MKQLHVNHVDISYETVGQGRPVILIHGNGEDHTIFDRTAAILEKRFTCYLPDSRGHGRSRWIGEFHYREMAEDLIQFMEKLNLRNAAVVGFSDGGIIGLMAAARTDRISSLIACGANTRPEGLRGLYLLGMRILHFFGRSPLMRLMGSTDTILPYARIYAYCILIAGPAMTSSCVMNNILRYEGKAFFAMIGLTAGGLLNIFGDFLLVRVFNLGIFGAGLSTTISQYISMGILLLPYLQGKTQSGFRLQDFTRSKEVFQHIIANGFPSLTRQGLNSISTMVLNSTAAIYGDPAVAAISIVTRVINFLFCIAIGIGQGFQPVSAFNFGAGIYSRVRKGFFFALKTGTIIMAVLSVLCYFNSVAVVQFFRNDAEVIVIGEAALRWQCISLLLMPVTMYGNMLFQSIGYSKAATFLASLRSGLILIPCVVLLNLIFGLKGLETAQAVSEILSALITAPFLVHFFAVLPEDQKGQ